MKAKLSTFPELAIALTLVIGAGVSGTACAETILAQDFENGLGPNESTFGAFSINDTLATLNNGTLMMGHSAAYGPLGGATTPKPSYSYYELVLDLRGVVDAQLQFEITGGIEKEFDGFNLVASAAGPVDPPNGLLSPTVESGLQYGALVIQGHLLRNSVRPPGSPRSIHRSSFATLRRSSTSPDSMTRR